MPTDPPVQSGATPARAEAALGPVTVHLTPATMEPAALAGSVVIIVDQLRASTTVCAALASGARRVVPLLMPDEARVLAHSDATGHTLTGGERGGERIDGFDLGNSPAEYTKERVGGRDIAFTTTNGTKAALLAKPASLVLVGCLGNRSALRASLARDPRPVVVVCAGTRDRLTLEDVLAAGAIVDALATAGRPVGLSDPRPDDDSAKLALALWRSVAHDPALILNTLVTSRGGRNLSRIGKHADIADCAVLDRYEVVPTLIDGAFVAGP